MRGHRISKFLFNAGLILFGLSLFTTDQAAIAQDFDSSFTVTIREDVGIPRRSEPTKVSLPFAVGALGNAKDVAVFDANGKSVPT